MLTIDALRQYGANTKEGLSRCMNNEAFYLRVVGMSLDDPNFEKLSSAIEKDDRKERGPFMRPAVFHPSAVYPFHRMNNAWCGAYKSSPHNKYRVTGF